MPGPGIPGSISPPYLPFATVSPRVVSDANNPATTPAAAGKYLLAAAAAAGIKAAPKPACCTPGTVRNGVAWAGSSACVGVVMLANVPAMDGTLAREILAALIICKDGPLESDGARVVGAKEPAASCAGDGPLYVLAKVSPHY